MVDRYYQIEPPVRPSSDSELLEWQSTLVGYENHYAYQDLIANTSFGQRVGALMHFGKSMLPLLVKRLIKYELIPLELRKPQTGSERLALVRVALFNAIGIRSGSVIANTGATPGQKEAIYERLVDDGCCVTVAPSSEFQHIESLASEQFEALEQRRAASLRGQTRAFDESRASVDKRAAGNDLFDAVNRLLEESGVLNAVERYLNRPVALVDVNPQINDSTDSFWKEIYSDLKQDQIPGAAYFHRDASGGDLKAIIYFSEVGPDNGPFTYVLGSNKLKVSGIDDLICEANDHNGMSGTDLSSRRSFAALPSVLRQKCSFGNDVLEQTDLAMWIKERAWSIEGPKGSIVLFDTKGVHRGGMVKAGQRRVITCVIG